MSSDSAFNVEALRRRLMDELQGYATSRKNNVARGAETPELAALLAQKYGYGVAKAAEFAADLVERPSPDLMKEVDRLVAEIDPNVDENRQKRWSARPAGLSIG